MVMASFDKSLFTHISAQFKINLILDQIYVQDVKTFYGLTKTHLKTILIWSCTGTMFQFNNQIYEQIDGVSMGSPIAPCMAKICMNWVLNQALNNANLYQPTILRRYVDDLFCIYNNEAQLDDFFNTLNAIHANIKFTKELEHENQLAYLDVLLTRNNDFIKTTVYRKKKQPCWSLLKWCSLCIIKYKCNLVICLLERAYRICNSYMSMHFEFQLISSMLLNNEYPRRFIDYQIRKFMNKKHLTLFSCNSFYSQSIPQLHKLPRIFFELPYIGEPSIHLETELKHYFRMKLRDEVQLTIIHVTNKLEQFFNHKEKQPLLLRSNVVYRLTCSCGSCNIVQTRRNIKCEMKEHNPEVEFSYKTFTTQSGAYH